MSSQDTSTADASLLTGRDWIKYDGKGRPVPNGIDIEISRRDGSVRSGAFWSAITWSWSTSFPSEDVMFWRLTLPSAQAVREDINVIGRMVLEYGDNAQHDAWIRLRAALSSQAAA